MREIKFRAWYKPRRMMCEVSEIDFNEGEVECWVGEPIGDVWVAKLSDVELMQYIGLNDKNGVEIYEGDILSYLSKFELHRAHRTIGTVVFISESESPRYWSTPRFVIKSLGDTHEEFGDTGDEIQQSNYDFEVIGNVYENPEQLTKEDKTLCH